MAVQNKYNTFREDQREFFDALISEDWESYSSASWDETRRYEIEKMFKTITPSTVLDIGCGCGFHDLHMASYPFVKEVHAFDYSEKSVAKANEAYPHSHVSRWVGDFTRDVPKQRYELVASFQVFEHLSDVAPYFKFCRAACAPDGHVAIFTPNRLRLSNRLRSLKGMRPEFLDPQHYKEYTIREVVEFGRQAGLAPYKSFGYGLAGVNVLESLSNATRLKLGGLFPSVASGLCIILQI